MILSQNELDSTVLEAVELSTLEWNVNSNDSKDCIVDQFTITRGIGTVYVLFETVPLWLSVLSPLYFKYLCFPQFTCISHLKSVSKAAKIFSEVYLNLWSPSTIKFTKNKAPNPGLILISGSTYFLDEYFQLKLVAPALVTQEFKQKSRAIKAVHKWSTYRHYLNGGCTNLRVKVGFWGLNPPSNIVSMPRTLGDFLDYSLSSKRIPFEHTNRYVSPKEILDISNLNNKISVPNFRFKSKTGIRALSSKEIYQIWGLSQLSESPLLIKEITMYVPTQPLSLVLKSYLTSIQPLEKVLQTSPIPVEKPSSEATFFPDIGVSISNTWTTMDLNSERSKKADNAPVPSELWDRRLSLSFPSDRGILHLASCLRTMALTWYRRRMLHSLCTYLRSSFPNEYSNYLLGQRKTLHRGGMELSDFLKSLESGRDVLKRAADSIWFE